MKNNPLISVIMPVYNTPKDFFIPAIEAVLNQTYKNIEFIIVDDGSTTNIKDIVDSFKDSRILYINKGHHGAGEARNIGINISKGDYIYVTGSDDTIDSITLEFCINMLKKYDGDIISFNICGYGQKNDGKITLYERPIPFNITKPGDATQILKKSLIKKNEIYYENFTSCNDVTFTFTALALAQKVIKVNKGFYHYNMNVPGQISSNRGKKAMNVFLAFDALKYNLEKHNLFETYAQMFYRQFADCVKYEMTNIYDKEYKQKFLIVLKEKYPEIYKLVYPPAAIKTKVKTNKYF